MKFIKKFIDLILYGNFWIGFGALALAFQTQWILAGSFEWNAVTWYVFTSTVFLYALHRIVGILRVKDFLDIERYAVITRFRHHIIIYAVVAGLAAIYFFFQLKWRVQLALVIPALLSLAYVLPFFGKKRRLRDFNQVKIFLIAGVWAVVTVLLPFMDSSIAFDWPIIVMILERAMFIFAITLPFDIRDLKVDEFGNIKTIPGKIGVQKTIWLALGILAITFLFSFIIYAAGLYSAAVLGGLFISYLSTALLIFYSNPNRHDYYYSGLMDGTMIFQFLFILGVNYFI